MSEESKKQYQKEYQQSNKERLLEYKRNHQWNSRNPHLPQRPLPVVKKYNFELSEYDKKEEERMEKKRVEQWERRHPNGEPCPPKNWHYNSRAHRQQREKEVIVKLKIRTRCPNCRIINPDSTHNCLSSGVIYQGILQHD